MAPSRSSKPNKRQKAPPPTLEQFAAYQGAWGYFNTSLFDGALRPCLLTFSRHRGCRGFFTAERWQKDKATIHEICLNPDLLRGPTEESLSLLVRLMVNQWQQDYGHPPRRCYYDREWATKMAEVGLIPSTTGKPGGRRTGQRVSHYIDPDGKFVKALGKMPRDCLLPWTSGEPTDAPFKANGSKPPRRAKLTCPACGLRVWMQVEDVAHLIVCEECGQLFLAPGESPKARQKENPQKHKDDGRDGPNPPDLRGVFKKVFAGLARDYHPDRIGGDGREMQVVNEVQERLRKRLGI
jgi:hypothetical protein